MFTRNDYFLNYFLRNPIVFHKAMKRTKKTI